MNLFEKLERPILDCLTRVYKKNGKYVQTTKQYKRRTK